MSALEDIPPPRGEFVSVGGGRRLRAVLAGPAGRGRPTVILESGSFGFSADWAAVQARLAAAGLRSLAYDRAGLGFSDPGPAPRVSAAIAGDLERLLAALGETGPFLYCGHSMAGLHARVFAARNRARLTGIVLVDAATPEGMDEPLVRQLVGHFGLVSKLAAWGAQSGVVKPLTGAFGDAIGLSSPAKEEKHRAFADPVHNRWASAEAQAWALSAEEGRAAGPFDPAWPLAVVFTAATKEGGAREAMQAAPARASARGFIVQVPGANHASLLGEKFCGRIVEAILKVERLAAND